MAWYHYFSDIMFIYFMMLVALGDLSQTGRLVVAATTDGSHTVPSELYTKDSPIRPHLWILLVVAFGILIFGVIIGCLMRPIHNWSTRVFTLLPPEEDVAFLKSIRILPPKFSSQELRSATTNFSKVLGRGGFGTVYEGNFSDGTKIAVKRLDKSGQGRKDFEAEISTVGVIRHNNLIQMYGFCCDGLERILIYEFIVHGSLDRWLFGDDFLPWAVRFQIVVDIATGLCYLHKDCTHKIIHFDIKPHNILLDNHFRTKIADFGMSMLCDREESQVETCIRGTKGYYAPELRKNTKATTKCDVYSFGMVLLEIIGGRKNIDGNLDVERWFFPTWVVNQMKGEGECRGIVDIRLHSALTAEDWMQINQAVKIALWCINDNIQTRPAMENVVNMLKGTVEVDNPPMGFDFLLEGGGY